MKKSILALTMIMIFGLSTAIASEETKVDPRVLTAFQKDFSFAKEVTWELKPGRSIARFSLYDLNFIAWFNEDAELMGTARNLLYKQLPLSVIKALEEKYSEADFTSMLEVTRDFETNYYIGIEKNGRKLLLKANSSGSLTVVKKIKL